MKTASLVLAAALSTLGVAAQAGPLDLSTGSAGFSNTPVAGSFVDTYTFSVVVPVIASGSITSVVNGAQDIDFSTITLSGPSGSFSFTLVNPDPFETWGLSGTTIAAGNYTITLAGTNSAAGASYGGNFAVTPAVSAVPEPATTALLLAGLGAVGLAIRRRQSDA